MLEQKTSFEETKLFLMFRLDVKDDVNVNSNAAFMSSMLFIM